MRDHQGREIPDLEPFASGTLHTTNEAWVTGAVARYREANEQIRWLGGVQLGDELAFGVVGLNSRTPGAAAIIAAHGKSVRETGEGVNLEWRYSMAYEGFDPADAYMAVHVRCPAVNADLLLSFNGRKDFEFLSGLRTASAVAITTDPEFDDESWQQAVCFDVDHDGLGKMLGYLMARDVVAGMPGARKVERIRPLPGGRRGRPVHRAARGRRRG